MQLSALMYFNVSNGRLARLNITKRKLKIMDIDFSLDKKRQTESEVMESTLVLVCKRPALGVGKQRLADKLGGMLALQIAEALLECALEDMRLWPGSVVISPASVTDCDWAYQLFENTHTDFKVYPQQSGNLGQRLNLLDNELRADGMKNLIYIGSDSPALSQEDLLAAHDALNHFDTALKPTVDGGVSLMASSRPWPLLADLPWSTNRLGTMLDSACSQAGHSVATLPHGFDVDEPEDLLRVYAALLNDQRPARRTLFELTQKVTTQPEYRYANV